MKFKILAGTKLFAQLDQVGDQMQEANKKAFALCNELGFKKFRTPTFVLAGGIGSLPAEKKPADYAYTYGSKEPNDFFPKKINKNAIILAKIAALPVIEYSALNDPLKFDGSKSTKFSKTGGRSISFHPGIIYRKKYILIDVPEHINYKPVKDMIEITVSEYKTLANTKTAKELASAKKKQPC